jgi:hypothetical protein
MHAGAGEENVVKMQTARDLWRAATVLAVAAVLAGCSSSGSGGSGYGTGDPSLAAASPGGGPISPFLADGHAVLKAFDAIAARSGKPLRVTSLSSDRTNGLTVNAQEPKHHVNVDEYVVAPDGTLTGPTPVKMMSLNGGPITARDVDLKAYDPRAIPFARLAQTVRQAIAKSHFADARVSEWEIGGIGEDDRRFIYFDAARGRPAAEITPSLQIVQIHF